MNSKWIKIVIAFGLVIVLAALFYTKVYIPKSTYRFVTPTIGSLAVERFGIGDIGAKDIYPITAQTGGKIIKLYKDQGDLVKKGEVVASIDPVDLYKLIQEAEDTKKKASFVKKAAQKTLSGLEAQLELAQITYDRYLKLYKKKFAAKVEYDKAKADLKTLQSQVAGAKDNIAAARQEQDLAQKNIEALQEKMDRLSVRSPVDGYVISRDAIVGQAIAPTQPLITVVNPKTVWVRANIDERISKEIKVGQKVKITLRSMPNKPIAGYVARIEAQSDPVTEERIVDAAFLKLPKPFFMNEQAEVNIHVKTLESVLKIPVNVLVFVKGKEGVWIYKNGKAKFAALKILALNKNMAAVSGINENTKILLPNPKKKPLSNGVRVRL